MAQRTLKRPVAKRRHTGISGVIVKLRLPETIKGRTSVRPLPFMLARLLDASGAARDLDRFRAGQGFEVTIGESDETAARAKLYRLAGAQRQFALGAAFGHDQGPRLGIPVDRAGGESRTAHGQQS